MGTPDFAVATLQRLVENNLEVVAVVTAPDKPVGRGLKVSESPVKRYAVSQNIPVLQPEKLKNKWFLEELAGYKADLQVVVAAPEEAQARLAAQELLGFAPVLGAGERRQLSDEVPPVALGGGQAGIEHGDHALVVGAADQPTRPLGEHHRRSG